MRFSSFLIASLASLSLAAPSKRQDSDPLNLGPTIEDVTNQVTGLVGSILKRQDSDPLNLGPTLEDVTNQVSGLVGSILKRQW